MRWLACALVFAVAPAAAAPPVDDFAVDIVGPVLPVAPIAGDYAMQLRMSFETFPTTEMRIDESLEAKMTMTLAPTGTARACVGVHAHHTTAGQWHYERDPAKRQHHETDSVSLVGLGGTWRAVGAVATITFDTIVWQTCDLAKATKLTKPYAELTCAASAPTKQLPVSALLCETVPDQLGIGMLMTPASRTAPPQRIETAPHGTNIVLGAPGIAVTVDQQRRQSAPAIAFTAQVVNLVEKDYLSKKK